MTSQTTKNQEFAREIQHKFDYYVMALTFTVLGLSIQSVDFDDYKNFGIFMELASWTMLFVSSLFSLSRLEWQPALTNNHVMVDRVKKEISGLENAKTNGEVIVSYQNSGDIPIDDAIDRQSEILSILENQQSSIKKETRFKYGSQRFTLIAGFFLLFLARAHQPAMTFLDNL